MQKRKKGDGLEIRLPIYKVFLIFTEQDRLCLFGIQADV